MADLSPAALAVMTAANASATNAWSDATHQRFRSGVAAALRAAVAHTQQHHGHDVWECDANELLAIAAELEGASDL